MAITEKNRRRAEMTDEMLANSNMPPELIQEFREAVAGGLAATNGLTPSEKLQAVAENQFNLTRMFAFHIVQSFEAAPTKKRATWPDAVIRCKWQLVLLTFLITALFAYRPEVALAIEHMVGR